MLKVATASCATPLAYSVYSHVSYISVNCFAYAIVSLMPQFTDSRQCVFRFDLLLMPNFSFKVLFRFSCRFIVPSSQHSSYT